MVDILYTSISALKNLLPSPFFEEFYFLLMASDVGCYVRRYNYNFDDEWHYWKNGGKIKLG